MTDAYAVIEGPVLYRQHILLLPIPPPLRVVKTPPPHLPPDGLSLIPLYLSMPLENLPNWDPSKKIRGCFGDVRQVTPVKGEGHE